MRIVCNAFVSDTTKILSCMRKHSEPQEGKRWQEWWTYTENAADFEYLAVYLVKLILKGQRSGAKHLRHVS